MSIESNKITSKNAIQRDKAGRFLPGSTPNPNGRPKGASCTALRLASSFMATEGIGLLVQAARGGDLDALKVLAGLLPRRKPVALPEQVPHMDPEASLSSQAAAVVASVQAGSVDPDTGNGMMTLLLGAAKIQEHTELKAKVEALAASLERLEQGQGGI